jgi:peptidoglycan LD-endopeptidase LytH
MTIRHRRRAIHAEAIAPWVALSFIVLMWWAASKALEWVRPGQPNPLWSIGRGSRESGGDARSNPAVPRAEPRAEPLDEAAPLPKLESAPSAGFSIEALTSISNSDITDLRSRHLLVPVRGIDTSALVSSFEDSRGRRVHEAIDILAPLGADVLAVEDGRVAKIFTSDAGGLTVYQFDPSSKYAYYYAHLDSYAPALKEGAALKRGDVIGYVGTTGNAPKNTPHLHFAISKLDPDQRWWGGTALDPFLIWRDPAEN